MTFEDFWPEYVRAHSKPATQAIHCLGTMLGWVLLGAAIAVGRWWWIVLSATPALVGVFTYVWYEFRVIERAGDRQGR